VDCGVLFCGAVKMVKPQYIQMFRPEWLKQKEFSGWLKEVSDDPSKGYCKYCYSTVRSRRADLLAHVETKKHKLAAGSVRK